jgi:hypothetical protein
MLVLSDIPTACSRYIEYTLLGLLAPWLDPQSTYTFPQEVPSSKDWLLWRTFWTLYLGPGGLLHIPLGEKLHPSHRIWEWFYDPTQDQLQHVRKNSWKVYKPIQAKQDTRYTQHYYRHSTDSNPAIGSPCNVRQLSPTTVQRQEMGPQLTLQREVKGTFWENLQSIGGEWMWEYIEEGEADVLWLRDALTTGILVGVMDGFYNRHKVKALQQGRMGSSMQIIKEDSEGIILQSVIGGRLILQGIAGASGNPYSNTCGGRILPPKTHSWQDMLRQYVSPKSGKQGGEMRLKRYQALGPSASITHIYVQGQHGTHI